MKLLGAVLSSVALANNATDTLSAATTVRPLATPHDWPGISEAQTCGSQKQFREAHINKTCTLSFNGGDHSHVFIGGQFVWTDTNMNYKFTSYDGHAEDDFIDVVVFWNQETNQTAIDAGAEEGHGDYMDPTNCGEHTDIDVTCVDTEPDDKPYFMETANVAVSSGVNVQIKLNNPDLYDYVVELKNWEGQPYGTAANEVGGKMNDAWISCSACNDMVFSAPSTITFTKPDNYVAEILEIVINTNGTVIPTPDFWKSTVVAT
jgi:hypothetical protein